MSDGAIRRKGGPKVETYRDDDDVYSLEDPTEFSQSVPGNFRGRVQSYGKTAEFAHEPLFGVGEVVYLILSGQAQPAGPYVVGKIDDDGKYRIKRQDNAQEHPQPVTEQQLVVPA